MKKELFRTRTIDLASFYLAKGVRFVGIEPLPSISGIYEFIFEDTGTCQKLKQEFLAGAEVSAQQLLTSKSFLMSELNAKKSTRRASD